jgi:hypothetical protein
MANVALTRTVRGAGRMALLPARAGEDLSHSLVARHMRPLRVARLVSLVLLAPLAACGGGASPLPAASSPRESGQSSLMDTTFAGKNKCNAKAHDRPFVIEWDATDASQFESIAAGDVVFVRYEGCEMRVIDSCRSDAVKGSLGSYKPVEWTSGAVEKVDIGSEADLYAKLPLGAATIGGRVSAGERFRMEYFVSGTRTATRPSVFKADVDKVSGCRGVTHFVYAFNLGAFALGSTKDVKGAADATLWGATVGGSTRSKYAADKRGGLLESCRAEGAKELATCKAPIRLTLREIEAGADPDAAAATAVETPSALNLAGKVDAKMKRSEKAQAFTDAALERRTARDGKACLAALDSADRLDPRPQVLSTTARSYWSSLRAQCLMLAGQCSAGRQTLRKYMEASAGDQMTPERLDQYVDAVAGQTCQGTNLSPRDQLLQANDALRQGAEGKKDVAYCRSAYERVSALAKTVEPRDADDTVVASAKNTDHAFEAAKCLARAGDCPASWQMYASSKFGSSRQTESFHNTVPHCKAYQPPQEPGSKLADPAVTQKELASAMTSASQKAMAKDSSCLAEIARFDKIADATQKKGIDSVRAICLMVAGRCDEGERVQRRTLEKVDPKIVDLNVKSIRHDWCR